MKKLILFSPLLIVLFASCSPELYQPIHSVNEVSLEDLKEGRNLYVYNCASCHRLYSPNKFNTNEWKININKMQPKAKITDVEKQLIFDYLVNSPMKK